MRIRKATEEDRALLIQLRVDYLLDQNGGKPLEDEEGLIKKLDAYLRRAMERRELIAVLAEEEGKAVSTALLSIAERPPRPGNSSNKVGTIYSVFTYPAYRRKGYATRVLEFMLEEARKDDVATVDLYATAEGKPLYEKLGFQLAKYTYMKKKWKAPEK